MGRRTLILFYRPTKERRLSYLRFMDSEVKILISGNEDVY